MLFGRGATGGVINAISKKAEAELIAQGEFTYGFYDFKRGTFDVGGAVTNFLNLRLNALYQDAGSFRDFNYTDRWGLAPAIGLSITPDTELSLQLLHQEEDSVFDYGLPMFRGKPASGVSRDIFYGYPDDRLQEFDVSIAIARLTHRFTSNFSVQNSFRYADYERYYRINLFGAVIDTGDTSTVARNQALRLNNQRNYYNQSDFVWKSSFQGMPSTILTRLHLGSGLGVAWILLADTFAGGIIVLSLTGILLWTRLHGLRLAAAGLGFDSLVLAVIFL